MIKCIVTVLPKCKWFWFTIIVEVQFDLNCRRSLIIQRCNADTIKFNKEAKSTTKVLKQLGNSFYAISYKRPFTTKYL